VNNHYRSIDVPLILGYELGNDKLHININAGPVINVYSWQKGVMLDTSFKPVNITTGTSGSSAQYKSNFGLGVIGSISVYYKLNEQTHLLAEPYFRYNFSSISREGAPVKEKYATIGLRIGLRFDLHKKKTD
ncbi:MAG: hypothetical protein HY305_04645, partial [Sphingobacteriales bacterium]|nr:hypothetical protein [Sphingobacteriales bacterium]